MSCRHPAILLVLVVALGACAHQGQVKPGDKVTRFDMDPMRIEVVRGAGGPHVEAFDAATLFEQAGQDLEAQRFAESAAAYERVIREFPQGRFLLPSLYNAGLSYEGLRRFDEAAARYRRLTEAQPDGKDARDAHFRLGACLAELKSWPASLEIFQRLQKRADLSLTDRVEAMAREGLAQVELGDLPAAERTFQKTLDHFKDNEAQERLDSDFFVAMAQFYLGNIPHRMFKAMPLRMPQRQLEKDIEAKARMFLTAQSRYIDTVKIKNPVWATAAGFQIGALYREMYDTLVNSPLPPELDTDDKKQIYADVLKEKLRVLLEKARTIHEKNVLMAERTGVSNDWVRRSNEQLEELERLLGEVQDRQKNSAQQPAPKPAAPARTGPDFRPHEVM